MAKRVAVGSETVVKKSVRVAVRIRPFVSQVDGEDCPNDSDSDSGGEEIKDLKRSVVVTKESNIAFRFQSGNTIQQQKFKFDTIFDTDSSQETVFETEVIPLLEDVFNGRNATLLCYGPTGSGKTFTCVGNDHDPGMIPRSVEYAMKECRRRIAESRECNKNADLFNNNRRRVVKKCILLFSCLEIYNEKVFDLLTPHNSNSHSNGNGSGNDLKILETSNNGIVVKDLIQTPLQTMDQFFTKYALSLKNRQTAFTHLNAHSSRSHAIITLQVEQYIQQGSTSKKITGKFSIVDLAGSENSKKSGNTGLRHKESGNINKSLFALSQVIEALNQHNRPPYRNSKLTRLLSDSLGGSAVSTMVCCVSPGVTNAVQSRHCLAFGSNTRKIENEIIQHITIKKNSTVNHSHSMAAGRRTSYLKMPFPNRKRASMCPDRTKDGMPPQPKRRRFNSMIHPLSSTNANASATATDVNKENNCLQLNRVSTTTTATTNPPSALLSKPVLVTVEESMSSADENEPSTPPPPPKTKEKTKPTEKSLHNDNNTTIQPFYPSTHHKSKHEKEMEAKLEAMQKQIDEIRQLKEREKRKEEQSTESNTNVSPAHSAIENNSDDNPETRKKQKKQLKTFQNDQFGLPPPLTPGNTNRQLAMANIKHGRSHETNGELEKAKHFYQAASELMPGHTRLKKRIAKLEQKMTDDKNASSALSVNKESSHRSEEVSIDLPSFEKVLSVTTETVTEEKTEDTWQPTSHIEQRALSLMNSMTETELRSFHKVGKKTAQSVCSCRPFETFAALCAELGWRQKAIQSFLFRNRKIFES